LRVDDLQPVGHTYEQRIPKLGDFEHRVELTPPDDEQVQIGERRDPCVGVRAIQGRQLSKEVTGADTPNGPRPT
jgi:hypothetical protein